MRQISDTSLAALQQLSGIEPVIIVKVWWGGTTAISYCDRKFEAENLVGRLAEISNIEDIIDINAAASSVSLSITLDDSDGSIKDIYDVTDIHKVRVQVYQWFSNLPLTEAFIIFEGEIASPIIWSEGARTLKFDVITKLEDREVGFSAEEGQFEFIPASIVGKAWPLVFGRVAGIKALQLSEAPSAIFSFGFGIVNNEIWQQEIDALSAASAEAYANSQEAYQAGIGNAIIAGAYKQFGSMPDDPNLALQHDNAAQQYFAQASEYAAEFLELEAEIAAKLIEWDLQKSYEYRVITITQTNLPVGVPLVVEFSNYTANAIVVGTEIILTNLTELPDINELVGTNEYIFGDLTDDYLRTDRGQKFVWFDGGTQVRIRDFPRYFIASLGHVEILNVWARNRHGRAVVPTGWYTVEHTSYSVPNAQFGNLDATRIIFETPLTSRPGEWEDGDIEIDCVSSIGPNIVDIMEWVIARFCSLGTDSTSFNHVRALVNAYPANFALTTRMDVVKFLQDVVFQSRCAIWINDRKFFLRYLPEELTAVDTIGDSDVESSSLTLTSTDTERVVTKFTALWRERQNQNEPNKIIYRNNILKYGLHEEEYDFYIYNNQELVAKSAEFWMIRKSNTWKILRFKAILHKLRLETFDPVEVEFNEVIAAETAITGIIQKATFDPDDDTILMEIWLPVRLGEMHKYIYANPMEREDIYPPEDDPNIRTGNPFEGALGTIAPVNIFPPYQAITYSILNPFTQGRSLPIGDAGDEAPGSLVTALHPSNIDQSRPLGIEQFNNEKRTQIAPIQSVSFRQMIPGTWPGLVVSKVSDNLYNVSTYFKGLSNTPTTIQVKILKIRAGSTIPTTAPLQVHRAVWLDESTGVQRFEYWAQPPIWMQLDGL